MQMIMGGQSQRGRWHGQKITHHDATTLSVKNNQHIQCWCVIKTLFGITISCFSPLLPLQCPAFLCQRWWPVHHRSLHRSHVPERLRKTESSENTSVVTSVAFQISLGKILDTYYPYPNYPNPDPNYLNPSYSIPNSDSEFWLPEISLSNSGNIPRYPNYPNYPNICLYLCIYHVLLVENLNLALY
jgi:hypothetical protein